MELPPTPPNHDRPTIRRCGQCGDLLGPASRYCEACGETVVCDDPPADDEAGTTGPDYPATCPHCGGRVDADRYCTSCGLAATERAVVRTRGESAAATHRGRHRTRNEDAVGLARTDEGQPVLVVADGVSHSPNPHLAAAAAVRSVVERLDGRRFSGTADLTVAVAEAQAAVSRISGEHDPLRDPADDPNPPACTLVVMVAVAGGVCVANVGDSRGYLLEPAADGWAATLLTTDDSVGSAVTAWLGEDAPDIDAHVVCRPARPGALIMGCTDGLWNYAPEEETLAHLVGSIATSDRPTADTCELLVAWAIARGGADNIGVALAPVPEPPSGRPTCAAAAARPGETREID